MKKIVLFCLSLFTLNSNAALSAFPQTKLQKSLCTQKEFAARLEQTVEYAFKLKLKDGSEFNQTVNTPFLCFTEKDIYAEGKDAYETDILVFTAPCDRNNPAEREQVKRALIHFFPLADRAMQNFLCSNELKRIWVGGDGSSSTSNYVFVDEKPFFALGMLRGLFNYSADPTIGFSGLLTWYAQKKTSDGQAAPLSYADGTQVRATLSPKFKGQVNSTDAVLMDYLYHELGHFALHGVVGSPAFQDYDLWSNMWTDATWPSLSFDSTQPLPLDDNAWKTADIYTQRARETICFWGTIDGRDCTANRIRHNDPNFGELYFSAFTSYNSEHVKRSAPGFLSILSVANPTEQFCEWLSSLALTRYFDSIVHTLPPSNGKTYVYDSFEAVRTFDRGDGRNYEAAREYIADQIQNLDSQLTRASGF